MGSAQGPPPTFNSRGCSMQFWLSHGLHVRWDRVWESGRGDLHVAWWNILFGHWTPDSLLHVHVYLLNPVLVLTNNVEFPYPFC